MVEGGSAHLFTPACACLQAGLAMGFHPIRARSLEGFVGRREAGEGSLLGEVAFFTEVPQLEVSEGLVPLLALQ